MMPNPKCTASYLIIKIKIHAELLPSYYKLENRISSKTIHFKSLEPVQHILFEFPVLHFLLNVFLKRTPRNELI